MSIVEALARDRNDLRDLVRRHNVCFDSYPIWHVPHEGAKVAIGYELDLTGTFDHPQHPPIPGCEECRTIQETLVTIANAIVPQNVRASRSEVGSYGIAIHFSPRRQTRDGVVVSIDVVHRDRTDRAPDIRDMRCIREMEEKLTRLGARTERS